MNLNTGYFPPHGYRRKQPNTSYHLPLNHQQQQQQLSSVKSARSSMESTSANESFLPSISAAIVHNDGHRPYRRNDFANNHLFLAKRKLAGILLGQSTRNLQATSDLIHLFDQPTRKKLNSYKHKQQDSATNKTSSDEQDAHLSVVNLVIKPPHPSSQTRDPLTALLRYRRTPAHHLKPIHSSIDAMNSTAKLNLQSASLHTLTANNEVDDLIDNDHFSDALSTSIHPLDSSILCVKSIVPSQHHLIQHR